MNIKRAILTESTLQADLYCELKKIFTNVILEHTFCITGQTRTGRPRKLRADITVCDDILNVIAFVEVKSAWRIKQTQSFSRTRQFQKYTSTGIPFVYCTNPTQIEETVNFCIS